MMMVQQQEEQRRRRRRRRQRASVASAAAALALALAAPLALVSTARAAAEQQQQQQQIQQQQQQQIQQQQKIQELQLHEANLTFSNDPLGAPADARLAGWFAADGGGGGTPATHSGTATAAADDNDAAAFAPGPVVLSWSPRVVVWRGFLSDDECRHIRDAARPRLEHSGVSDSYTGREKHDKVRTSSGMFFGRAPDEVIARVERRVAMWTQLPPDHAEGMQVLRYERAEKYDAHHDYFAFKGRDANGGNRMATVLMYLSDVEAGGETVFPRAPRLPHQSLDQGWSNCSMQGLAVRPRKGDALLFYSIRPDGTFDHRSLHAGCPVIRGEKWSATKWIHVGRFALGPGERPVEVRRVVHAPPPPPAPAWCHDARAECEVWMETGECEVNPRFMVGNKQAPGACLLSCGRCDLAQPPPAEGAAAAA